jgi:hypothetical protein
LAKSCGPAPSKVRAGDVVEHEVGLEAKEVAETVVQRHVDLVLGRVQLIESAIPGVELAGIDSDPPMLAPVRDEASSLAIADEVGLEPTGQAVLAGGGDETIGDEHEGAVRERDAFGPPQVFVEDGPEPQLLEQGPDDEDRASVGRVDDERVRAGTGRAGGVPGKEALELGQNLHEKILAPEIGDDAVLDLAALAVGLDDADVFVDGAATGADFDGPGVHEDDYHDRACVDQLLIA